MRITTFFYCLLLLFIAAGCNNKPEEAPLFEVLDKGRTGLDFSNNLTPTPAFNMFKYMYFYNGAGVGAGDFNNDGLTDLFFAANQSSNRLYLNKGNLSFKDATADAGIPQDKGWSTGVSVVDINNDGLLDIYVCRVGNYEMLRSRNQLLVCQRIDANGTPVYVDEAVAYGLNFSGFSTQSAFLDYDMDGDLDMYLMNHSLRFNGTFLERSRYAGTYDSIAGDRLYRNDGKFFTDVTRQSGINSSIIGYGLGIAVSDIDLDGYPDLYIGNDFHENDYLYINQKNGTFKDVSTERTMHTSQFSMGVDVADVDNDAYPEIISMDMLPADPYILRRSLGEDAYDIFYFKVRAGYHYQYARNNLQYNRGNGMFSEVGLYSGVYATDWSWAPLWMDFDNDGWKDLFITNGIPKRLNDIDYVNYVSNDEIQERIRANRVEEKDMTLIEKFPQIKLPNKFFSNKGQMQFSDLENKIGGDKITYSNGAVYADFDNDGDLDIVVNNIDEPALLYQNKSNDQHTNKYLQLQLKGPASNVRATGAKLIVYTGAEVRTYEKYPVHGFQSSMEISLHIGMGQAKVDSIKLIWPDNSYQQLAWKPDSSKIVVEYKTGLPKFDYSSLTSRSKDRFKQFEDITQSTGLEYRHEENAFVEFDREPLIPFMLSAEGPALAVADANGDGLEDVFIGAARGKKSAIFFQQPSGRFERSAQPSLDADSIYEDVDACWMDVNNDKRMDLIVASGGNEFFGYVPYLLPRAYLNNGNGGFVKMEQAFDSIYLTASCVLPQDFDGDGYVDLFIGARAVPFEYGKKPRSYLLKNDKGNRFVDVTASYASDLQSAGFVKQGSWCDIDKDGDQDLLLAMEWDGIFAFVNDKGKLTRKALTDKKGWWNFVLPADLDNDGDLDLVAGNLGLNSRLKASEKEPVKLYYNDFDNNGKKEQVLTYYLHGKEIPFANKSELDKQMPFLKKKFLYAGDFGKATLTDLFAANTLEKSDVLTANYFANTIFINEGNFNFKAMPLLWEAQLTPYRDAAIVDANNDQLPDILLAGNFYDNNVQMGRYDADYGTLLINKGNGSFAYQSVSGADIRGQVRHIRKVKLANKQEALILARNNDSVMVIKAMGH
ncbi:MAG: VCBS repeat-containing protein [Chitinophagaceae bacterium]